MSRAAPRIRVRLTAWYAGSMFLLLFAATGVARAMLHHELDREFQASLRGSADLVRGFFRAELREYRAIVPTLQHINSELVFADRRIAFVEPSGTIFRAPGVLKPSLEVTLPTPVATYDAPLDAELAPGWMLRVSVSAADLERHRREVDDGALLAIPLAVLCATALGWWIAGRTLRPVAVMAEAASRITASRSAERLPIADPHDELGRLGKRFNALLDRLDAALGQQRRFLADAAHELRTPLARARSALEAAPASGGAEARLEATRLVARELTGMASLVEELLQLARADAAVRAPLLADAFVDDVVADVVAAFQPMANEAGIGLGASRLEEAPANCDATLVRRLAGILVDNALRYTPRGGRVDVRVWAEAGAACLEIEDSGIGFAEDERARIGERFFRGQRAREMAADGSGLGLAIAQWIAAQHGADLQFTTPPDGSGTLVRVRFVPPRG